MMRKPKWTWRRGFQIHYYMFDEAILFRSRPVKFEKRQLIHKGKKA